MKEKKQKPKPGNPSWPSGLPKSLEQIDAEIYRAAGMRPGRGALAQLFLVLADFAEGEDYALEDEEEDEEDKLLAGDKRS